MEYCGRLVQTSRRLKAANPLNAARLNVLFVCSRNRWRSPTAETIYRDDDRVNVRSRGTGAGAARTISATDVRWADLVLVMEQKHRKRILASFPNASRHRPIYVLDIPDEYRFMDPELIELIQVSVEPVVASEVQRGNTNRR